MVKWVRFVVRKASAATTANAIVASAAESIDDVGKGALIAPLIAGETVFMAADSLDRFLAGCGNRTCSDGEQDGGAIAVGADVAASAIVEVERAGGESVWIPFHLLARLDDEGEDSAVDCSVRIDALAIDTTASVPALKRSFSLRDKLSGLLRRSSIRPKSTVDVDEPLDSPLSQEAHVGALVDAPSAPVMRSDSNDVLAKELALAASSVSSEVSVAALPADVVAKEAMATSAAAAVPDVSEQTSGLGVRSRMVSSFRKSFRKLSRGIGKDREPVSAVSGDDGRLPSASAGAHIVENALEGDAIVASTPGEAASVPDESVPGTRSGFGRAFRRMSGRMRSRRGESAQSERPGPDAEAATPDASDEVRKLADIASPPQTPSTGRRMSLSTDELASRLTVGDDSWGRLSNRLGHLQMQNVREASSTMTDATRQPIPPAQELLRSPACCGSLTRGDVEMALGFPSCRVGTFLYRVSSSGGATRSSSLEANPARWLLSVRTDVAVEHRLVRLSLHGLSIEAGRWFPTVGEFELAYRKSGLLLHPLSMHAVHQLLVDSAKSAEVETDPLCRRWLVRHASMCEAMGLVGRRYPIHAGALTVYVGLDSAAAVRDGGKDVSVRRAFLVGQLFPALRHVSRERTGYGVCIEDPWSPPRASATTLDWSRGLQLGGRCALALVRAVVDAVCRSDVAMVFQEHTEAESCDSLGPFEMAVRILRERGSMGAADFRMIEVAALRFVGLRCRVLMVPQFPLDAQGREASEPSAPGANADGFGGASRAEWEEWEDVSTRRVLQWWTGVVESLSLDYGAHGRDHDMVDTCERQMVAHLTESLSGVWVDSLGRLEGLEVGVATAGGTLVVAGPPGCGKTALVARWLGNHRQAGRAVGVFYHSFAVGTSAMEHGLVRLLQYLHGRTGESLSAPVPTTLTGLCEAIEKALRQYACTPSLPPLVVVFDDMDVAVEMAQSALSPNVSLREFGDEWAGMSVLQRVQRTALHVHVWDHFPCRRVQVIATSSYGPCFEALVGDCGWRSYRVPRLRSDESLAVMRSMLGEWSVSMADLHVRMLLEHTALSRHPRSLRTVLASVIQEEMMGRACASREDGSQPSSILQHGLCRSAHQLLMMVLGSDGSMAELVRMVTNQAEREMLPFVTAGVVQKRASSLDALRLSTRRKHSRAGSSSDGHLAERVLQLLLCRGICSSAESASAAVQCSSWRAWHVLADGLSSLCVMDTNAFCASGASVLRAVSRLVARSSGGDGHGGRSHGMLARFDSDDSGIDAEAAWGPLIERGVVERLCEWSSHGRKAGDAPPLPRAGNWVALRDVVVGVLASEDAKMAKAVLRHVDSSAVAVRSCESSVLALWRMCRLDTAGLVRFYEDAVKQISKEEVGERGLAAGASNYIQRRVESIVEQQLCMRASVTTVGSGRVGMFMGDLMEYLLRAGLGPLARNVLERAEKSGVMNDSREAAFASVEVLTACGDVDKALEKVTGLLVEFRHGRGANDARDSMWVLDALHRAIVLLGATGKRFCRDVVNCGPGCKR
jgi:hypothetical protein